MFCLRLQSSCCLPLPFYGWRVFSSIARRKPHKKVFNQPLHFLQARSPAGERLIPPSTGRAENCRHSPLELFQGKNGFASYTPVLVPAEGDVETLAGVVNGIFAMDALVDDALKQTTWAQG